jgi:hypothetical protein
MIFVYPAIVSEGVDPKIAPAVCQVIEQFFLMHLAESFSSGNLRVKSIWDPRKEVYGPLVLEGKKTVGGILLEQPINKNKSSYPIEQEWYDRTYTPFMKHFGDMKNQNGYKIFYNGFTKKDPDHPWTLPVPPDLTQDQGSKLLAMLDLDSGECYKFEDFIDHVNREREATIKDYPKKLATPAHANCYSWLQVDADKELRQILGRLKIVQDRIKNTRNSISTSLKSAKNPFQKDKDERDKEKWEREKNKEDLSQYETHGSYKVEPMRGVSLKPSMMNIGIKIHYSGGPHEAQNTPYTSSGTMQEISIGSKVMPLRLMAFNNIENAILDDYFSTTFQVWWKASYRNFLRKSAVYVEKILKLLGVNVDMTSKISKGPAESMIIFAPKGYVDASSFRKKSGSASFYNYSAALVMFNKKDIMKEEGENFFLNRSQLLNMFKLGWNSFCILDPVREEVLFISSLDGGYLHVLPYAYIFNSVGMDKIYENMADLQRRSPVFRMKTGGFRTLVQRLVREFTILKSTKKSIKK